MSRKVVIYHKAYCPYCRGVINHLKDNEIPFEAIDVTTKPKLYKQLKEEYDHHTVPMIFIDDEFIGGSEDFYENYSDKLTG